MCIINSCSAYHKTGPSNTDLTDHQDHIPTNMSTSRTMLVLVCYEHG
jgi:hypothetical protein